MDQFLSNSAFHFFVLSTTSIWNAVMLCRGKRGCFLLVGSSSHEKSLAYSDWPNAPHLTTKEWLTTCQCGEMHLEEEEQWKMSAIQNNGSEWDRELRQRWGASCMLSPLGFHFLPGPISLRTDTTVYRSRSTGDSSRSQEMRIWSFHPKMDLQRNKSRWFNGVHSKSTIYSITDTLWPPLLQLLKEVISTILGAIQIK